MNAKSKVTEAEQAELDAEQERAELAEQAEAAKHAKVKMNAPKGATGCNVFNVEYTVSKDGHVTVPADAVDHLLTHGYTVA